MPPQGVVIGIEQPILYLSGNLMTKVTELEAICPPGCITVSKNCIKSFTEGFAAESFAPSVALEGSGTTYLCKDPDGTWETGLIEAPTYLKRYQATYPHGPVHVSAKKFRPVQLSLMLLAAGNPAVLLEGLSMGGKSAKVSARDSSDKTAVLNPSSFGSVYPDGGLKEVIRLGSKDLSKAEGDKKLADLQHEKDLLGKQLEEVSRECERLQVGGRCGAAHF